MSSDPREGSAPRPSAREKPSPFPGAVEFDARLPCPECGEPRVKLYVKASTTVGFACANPRCPKFEAPRPPDELQA